MCPADRIDEAWGRLETFLTGDTRRGLVNELARARTLELALLRLRRAMEDGVLAFGSRTFVLRSLVRGADTRVRQQGLHALHDWDGPARKIKATSIPVDVLAYLSEQRGDEPPTATTLAILLDYYLLYVLAVLAVAACLQDDADGQLDRVGRLLAALQGPGGSGQRFADDVGTLILLATSHYEPEERGYARLLDRVRALAPRHRLALALVHAASLGCHLRFGLEVTYGRDTVAMRDDNVADYPWLCFALATLAEHYVALRHRPGDEGDRSLVVEALLMGLSPDPRAFVGEPPPSLSTCRAEWLAFREMFETYRRDLLEEFAAQDPTDRPYSPLALSYNFAQNVVKGTVVDALLRGNAWPLSLNDLLTGFAAGDEALPRRRELAETLMRHARRHPDWIRGAWRPVILYDPHAGRRAFRLTMDKVRE